MSVSLTSIARMLKAEAGVVHHTISRKGGKAYGGNMIVAPAGRTPDGLYTVAHECGHIALGHCTSTKARHVQEMEAEIYAHAALRRHGVPIHPHTTWEAKRYVDSYIAHDRSRGVAIDPIVVAWVNTENC